MALDDESNFDTLLARVLRPARPQLLEVLCVLTRRDPGELRALGLDGVVVADDRVIWSRGGVGYAVRPLDIVDPEEAWEALASAGLIPMRWIGDARRSFVRRLLCLECGGDGQVSVNEPFIAPNRPNVMFNPPAPIAAPCSFCEARGWFETPKPHPPTLAACAAIASDPEGISTAELLAAESRIAHFDGEPSMLLRVLDTSEIASETQEIAGLRKRWAGLHHPAARAERSIARLGYLLAPERRAQGALEILIPLMGSS